MSESTWGWAEARHLLSRAGFGGRPEEIQAVAAAGPARGVAMLFDGDTPALPRPTWFDGYVAMARRHRRGLSPEKRKELQRKNRQVIREFQISWIQHMIAAPDPASMLREKMTLFWHGHFATSVRKVKFPPLLFQQLSFLHENALGSFRDLLHGIARDPAMLRYLDGNQNRKGRPNENFARELMELFSLGPGNYSESDIKEAARAFTGWTSDPLHFRVRRRQHDYGRKTFLGHSGNLDGDDVIDIILEQPACAEFITRKLLRFFGFEHASAEVAASFAQLFRDQDYALRPLLQAIFSHPDFYAEDSRGNQIKSPLQLVVGTARTLNLQVSNGEFFLHMLALMGQVPYEPPNVKGWPGGRAWIDTSRLLTRFTFGELVGLGKIPSEVDPRSRRDRDKSMKPRRKMGGMRRPRLEFEPERLLTEEAAPESVIGRLEEVLLCEPLSREERAGLVQHFEANLGKMARTQALKAVVGEMMSLPAYQLG
ncbi:MAG: DUF1800 domain-containing protein [Calditrichaeota bacterium]|nr:MAG: DUF1800 domain-containing protein [Calditrichota bacterium]